MNVGYCQLTRNSRAVSTCPVFLCYGCTSNVSPDEEMKTRFLGYSLTSHALTIEAASPYSDHRDGITMQGQDISLGSVRGFHGLAQDAKHRRSYE